MSKLNRPPEKICPKSHIPGLFYSLNQTPIGLQNSICVARAFVTCLPLQEVNRRGATRFTKDLRPLFPGYMFVAFEPQTGPWKKINSTIGVSKLVSFDSRPKSVPWGLVSDLMLRCDAAGKLLPPKQCTKGDAVKLLSGPFAEFIATVEHIDPQKRVWVLMDFLGRTSRISVSPKQLQVIG